MSKKAKHIPWRKVVIVAGIALASLAVLAALCYVLINSRSFQLFGGLTNRVKTSEKVVALTFDDGPEKGATEKTLATLKEQNIPATFFLIGSRIEANPDLARQIVDAGHQVGNHSYSHEHMVFRHSSFYEQEITKTDAAIRSAGYRGDIVFRPPYGKKFYGLPLYLALHGRHTVMWDVEPESTGAESAEQMVDTALADTKPGSIILLHTMVASREASRDAVGPIIAGLKAQGYTFVTVNELLGKR